MGDLVFKSLKTIQEMMFDRGFIDWSQEIQKINLQEIKATIMQKHIFNIDVSDSKATKLRILYALQPKFKISEIKKYLDDNFELTLIILREKISTTNMKSIDEIRKISSDIQVFQIKELQFNITHHYLVPKHELIGWDKEDEIEKIVTQYQLKNRYQLPIILKSDPVARYLNAKSGNIIRVTRSSPTAGQYILYRCCM